MKTSRIARETAKIAASASQADFVPQRQTRSFVASLQRFTAHNEGPLELSGTLKQEHLSEEGSSGSLSPARSVSDIEDALFDGSASRKRKRDFDSPSTAVTTISTSTSIRTSPRKVGAYVEADSAERTKKPKRQPAKRIVNKAGEEEIVPPANWEEIYDAVKEMRQNKLAPVDTMGCETLAEEHLSPQVSYDRRSSRQLLCLMISGQTIPNPYCAHALISDERHHECHCYAPAPK